VRLAEQFAEMGFVTTLYGHFADEGLCGDVLLKRFDAYDPTAPLDALIGFRDARLFDRRPTGPRFCALWLEDLAPAEGLTRGNAENIDRVYTVTHWHKQQLLDVHPWLPARQVSASRNGIVHRYFETDPAPEREHRVIYSSSPDRGGDIMLEIWPLVRERVPDAELVLTYSRWFDLVAGYLQAANDQLTRIRELLEQPGVQRIEGGLGQKDLAHLMRTACVWAHPSWYTQGKSEDGHGGGREFHETSCISAMEAQAAGCVVVASNWGAVTETVMHGTLVDGDPRDPNGTWRKVFVDSIVRGLTDPVIQETAQTVGPEMVRAMDWRGPAEQVAGAFAQNGVEHVAHHLVTP
jgi:glycosyltransferase involved in cell wall biosynthesis